MQDCIWYDKYSSIDFINSDITFVEDSPGSDIVTIAGCTYPVITYRDLIINPGDYGHISAFNIGYKQRMSGLNLNWLNSYSKSYIRFDDIDMGCGVRINWDTYIDGRTFIGNFVKLNAFVFVGHDSYIGDYSYISQHVVLDNSVTVGSRCYIFENSTLLPGVEVGDNTTIGAGSVVTKDIPEGVIAYGNPCKVVRECLI